VLLVHRHVPARVWPTVSKPRIEMKRWRRG
jgi:hypothetical protein